MDFAGVPLPQENEILLGPHLHGGRLAHTSVCFSQQKRGWKGQA